MISKPISFMFLLLGALIAMIAVFPYPQRLMMMYLSVGKWERAEHEANLVIEDRGANRQVIEFLAEKANQTGDPVALIKYLSRLAQLKKNDPDIFMQLAEACLWSGDPEKASEYLEKRLSILPKDEKTLWLLADLYTVLNRLKDAIRVEEQLLNLTSDKAGVGRGLASNYFLTGQLDKEMQLRKNLARWQPKNKENLKRLAELLLTKGHEDDSFQVLAEAITISGADPELVQMALEMAIRTGSQENIQKLQPVLISFYGDPDKAFKAVVDAGRDSGDLAHTIQILKNMLAVGMVNSGSAGQIPLTRNQRSNLELSLANLQLETDDILGAYQSLSRAVELDPSSEEAWTKLLQVAQWTGRPKDEGRVLDMRLKHRPEDLEAMVQKVRWLINQGQYQEAGRLLGPLAQAQPQNDNVWRLKMQLALARGEIEQARQAYAELARLNKLYPEESDFSEMIKSLGPGRMEDLPELRRLAQEHPGDRVYRDNYLRTAMYSPLTPMDLAFLDSLVAQNDDLATLDQIGRVLLAGSRLKEATALYEKMVGLEPENMEVRGRLMELYSWTGQIRKQLYTLNQQLARHPDDVNIRSLLAQTAFEANEYSLARVHFAWLDDHGALKPVDMVHYAEIISDLGETRKAVQLCRRLLESTERVTADSLIAAAQLSLALKVDNLASELTRKALVLAPKSPAVLKTLAQVQMAGQNSEAALTTLKGLLEEFPEDYEAHFLLGEAYDALGRPDEAMVQFTLSQKLIEKSRRPTL